MIGPYTACVSFSTTIPVWLAAGGGGNLTGAMAGALEGINQHSSTIFGHG